MRKSNAAVTASRLEQSNLRMIQLLIAIAMSIKSRMSPVLFRDHNTLEYTKEHHYIIYEANNTLHNNEGIKIVAERPKWLF